jgi:hypothetical protein
LGAHNRAHATPVGLLKYYAFDATHIRDLTAAVSKHGINFTIGNRLSFCSEHGSVVFDGIEIRALVGE